jgi:hypothetical protein
MYYSIHTHMKTTNSSKEGADGILRQIQELWPAAKGSLARIRKPCIRPNCKACKSGRKHPAFILSWNDGERRRCTYVPSGMVDDLRRAIANGRRIEKLLSQAGAQMVLGARNAKG